VTFTESQSTHWRTYAILLLVIIVVVSSQLGVWNYYYRSLSPAHPRNDVPHPGGSSYLDVNTLINYGNGSSEWFNRSDVPIGWNFYNLTVHIATVHSVFYSGLLNEHEIVGINGVASSPLSPFYWSLWKVCQVEKAWEYTKFGADDISLANGDVLAWYFSDNSIVPPVQGAIVVPDCQT
jgi:hypothetical protein